MATIDEQEFSMFNNKSFADIRLVIRNMITGQEKYIDSSKCILASKSVYFCNLFTNESGNESSKSVVISVESQRDAECFEDVIRHIYGEDIKSPYSEFVRIIIVAAKYNFTSVIKHCSRILSNNLSLDNCMMALELPKEIRKMHVVKKLLIKKAENIVARKFVDMGALQDPKNKFLILPHLGVLAIIKNPDLAMNSECSLFYMLCLWTNHDKFRRVIHFESFLPHIHFACMHYFFLLDVVLNVANRFVTDEGYRTPECIGIPTYLLNIRDSILNHLRQALENKIRINCYSKKPGVDLLYQHRKFYSTQTKFTVNYQFGNISKMLLQQKIYSKSICLGGYDFSYWIQLLKHLPDGNEEDTNLIIGGYLQCTSQIIPREFYLPVGIEMLVSQPPSDPRIVSKKRVIFFASENVVSEKLNIAGENFASIKNNQCPIIINDIMNVIVNVEILNNDHNCIFANDTSK